MEHSPRAARHPTAAEIITLLDLQPVPQEGGFYAETLRLERIPDDAPPGDLPAVAATAIYYLMTPTGFSALHRLPIAELFHFYLGDPVEQLLLFPDGAGQVARLGPDLPDGERPQSLVPAGVWQGARLAPERQNLGYALLGTTMTPGFEFHHYEHGDRAALLSAYPAFRGLIEGLTRPENAGEAASAPL